MKTILQVCVVLLLLLGLASCTQSGGYIGKRFGMWKVTEILIDGVRDANYDETMFWSFQSEIIDMKSSAGQSIGVCKEENGTLVLDYRYTDTAHPEPGSALYSPLPQSLLPVNTVIVLEILKLESRHMQLSYTSPEGKTIVYNLKKWG